jgi:hypothetical protein
VRAKAALSNFAAFALFSYSIYSPLDITCHRVSSESERVAQKGMRNKFHSACAQRKVGAGALAAGQKLNAITKTN